VAPSFPTVSDAELDVLKVLWDGGPGTVREIEARLKKRKRRWAYNTVLTLLTRLRDKGHVESDSSETAHVFNAVTTRDQLLSVGLSDLADRVCDGMTSPLVRAFVQGRRFSSRDMAELRQLLDELERKGRKGQP
jgi:BlaI family transcriptional regulator, penicillinase repressor